MDQVIGIVIQLLSGAVGGNAAGALLKNLSLGTTGNSIAGIVGGIGLGQVLSMLGIAGADTAGSAFDIGNLITSIGGGAVGGGVVMAIVGWLKGMMGSSS